MQGSIQGSVNCRLRDSNLILQRGRDKEREKKEGEREEEILRHDVSELWITVCKQPVSIVPAQDCIA